MFKKEKDGSLLMTMEVGGCRGRGELGIRAKGQKVIEGGEAYRLPEPQVFYPDVFDTKNADIDAENCYFWNINPDIST